VFRVSQRHDELEQRDAVLEAQAGALVSQTRKAARDDATVEIGRLSYDFSVQMNERVEAAREAVREAGNVVAGTKLEVADVRHEFDALISRLAQALGIDLSVKERV